jgi:hypothetical protein
MKVIFTLAAAAILTAGVAKAEQNCFGEEEYRVCTDSYTDIGGDQHIRSYDTEGNSYSLDTKTRDLLGGGSEITSSDSDGNSYSIKSWSDSTGVHSIDSDGNSAP